VPRQNPVESDDGGPVHRTPRGASPRPLRSDPFAGRSAAPQTSPLQKPEKQAEPEPTSAEPEPHEPAPPRERDWNFAVPEPIPNRTGEPLIDPDINWRQHAGLRAPLETAPIPDISRERFSENWQRMAAEPRRESRGRLRRRLQRSALTRWMFSQGRFEMGAAAGLLLLLALLVAAFVYGRRLLSGNERTTTPAAESTTTPR
jgi:hypothetical protein